jgi:hypothetical protein
MEKRRELEALLTEQLLSRGLGRVDGQLAFVHRGQAVTLNVDETIYRGYFITVLDRGHKVVEFRAGIDTYDWNAIAALIVDLAERRLERQRKDAKAREFGTVSRPSRSDLWTMLGTGLSSQLSMDPSGDEQSQARFKH